MGNRGLCLQRGCACWDASPPLTSVVHLANSAETPHDPIARCSPGRLGWKNHSASGWEDNSPLSCPKVILCKAWTHFSHQVLSHWAELTQSMATRQDPERTSCRRILGKSFWGLSSSSEPPCSQDSYGLTILPAEI